MRDCVCHENKKIMSLSERVMFFPLYRQKQEKQMKAKTVCKLQLGYWNILNISPLVYFEGNPWKDEIYFFMLAFLSFSCSLVRIKTTITWLYSLVHLQVLYQWKVNAERKKVDYMSLKINVIKGFLVSLQLLCFYGDLREEKSIKRMRYVHK